MDLENFDTVTRANEGAPCALKDVRTGKPTDAVITVRGMDSDDFQRLKADRARDMAARRESGNYAELTQEERDELAVDTLARMTVGWTGLSHGGQPLVFSVAAARDLYRRFPAIREQVNVFIADRANFLPA